MAALLLLIFLTALRRWTRVCPYKPLRDVPVPRTHRASPSKTSFVTSLPASGPGHACVTVDLLDGDHSLTTPVFVNATDLSLSIDGSTSSRVPCSFNSSNATNLHSLHLYGLRTVVISSVNVLWMRFVTATVE